MEGVTLQVEFAGAPVHVKVAAPETFVAELSNNGKTAFWPFVIVRLVLPFEFSVKSTPLPVRVSVWGELAALSVTASVPERGPPAVGVNATCIVHAVNTGTVLPQVLLPGTIEKSPVIIIPCTTSGTPPLLVKVTSRAGAVMPTPVAGKAIVEKGARDTPGGATPIPLRVTVCVRY